MPAFTGLGAQAPQFPIGSQNIHGSDGPSVADAASAANGTATGGPGHGDTADGSGQVTVPPVGQEPRLPIFDSLESDWFRRSGQTLSAAPAAAGRTDRAVARAGLVDVTRGRGLACGSGGGDARGGRNYASGAAEARSEG